jgi:hypothetical protein
MSDKLGEMPEAGVVSEDEARHRANKYLTETAGGTEWVMLEAREFPVGWVFIWDLKRNLEATQIGDKVPGCAPILVNRSDGSVHFTGTARSIEEYVDRYENATH